MDKKKLILTIITIILFIIVFILAFMLFNKYVLKKNFEEGILSFADKNQSTIFKIDKIVFFSNADSKNKNATASNFTIENLYQYTDIALFIDGYSSEKKLENTLKNVRIENIKWNTIPEVGTPKLYFKSINQFAKSEIIEENAITDKLDFSITSEDETNLDTPTLYNNLANPITLSYVNQNVKTDYTITNTQDTITYDGSLLKKCNVPLSSLKCNISFDIFITNNLGQEFKCSIFLDIPLENDDDSIYDGSLKLSENTNFTFYRFK